MKNPGVFFHPLWKESNTPSFPESCDHLNWKFNRTETFSFPLSCHLTAFRGCKINNKQLSLILGSESRAAHHRSDTQAECNHIARSQVTGLVKPVLGDLPGTREAMGGNGQMSIFWDLQQHWYIFRGMPSRVTEKASCSWWSWLHHPATWNNHSAQNCFYNTYTLASGCNLCVWRLLVAHTGRRNYSYFSTAAISAEWRWSAILLTFMLHQGFWLAVCVCVNTRTPSSTDTPKSQQPAGYRIGYQGPHVLCKIVIVIYLKGGVEPRHSSVCR